MQRKRVDFVYTPVIIQHEILKQEKANEKLKDKLNKIVNDRNGQQKIKIPCVNQNIIKGVSTGLKSKSVSKQEAFFTEIVEGMKRNHNDLIQENSQLKETIIQTYKKIKQIQFGVCSFKMQDGFSDSEMIKFNLAYHRVYENILTEILTGIDIVSEKPAQTQQVNDQHELVLSLRHDVETLKVQVKDQQEIIKEQLRLLEMSMDSDYYVPCEEIHDDGFEVTSIELKKQYDELQKRSANLDEQRQRFTEAAIKLGFERAAFEV